MTRNTVRCFAALLLCAASADHLVLAQSPSRTDYLARGNLPAQTRPSPLSAESIADLEMLAVAGNRNAQFALGGLHARGEGIPQDHTQAAHWWRLAAEQGLADAQNELGSALADGEGVPKNQKEAVKWFRLAAEQGHAVGSANLAVMLWSGAGVTRHSVQAVSWFRKSATQGLGWAQIYLGDAYYMGRGVSRDERQAIDWYRKAAEQDYVEAFYKLGMVLRTADGRGLRDRSSRARYGEYWLARAAQEGHEDAAYRLEKIQEDCRRVHLPAATAIQSEPAADSPPVLQLQGPQRACTLPRPGKSGLGVGSWMAVLADDGVVGFVDTALIEDR